MELYDKRGKAVVAARAFLDNRRADGDTLSAEDESVYAKMETDILALGREIERESRLDGITADLSMPISQPIVNAPQKPADAKTGRASGEYRAAMLNALRTNFRQVSNVLETGTDQSGGYLCRRSTIRG